MVNKDKNNMNKDENNMRKTLTGSSRTVLDLKDSSRTKIVALTLMP